MRSCTLLVLAFALIALGSALGATQDEGSSAAPSDELLAKAEEQASRGRYSQARATYRKLAKNYPATAAGRIAARRSEASAYLGRADLVRHGPSENRVDVLLMGDGYASRMIRSFVSSHARRS